MQSGIHPDWVMADYKEMAAGQGRGAGHHLRLLADGDRSWPPGSPCRFRPAEGGRHRVGAGHGGGRHPPLHDRVRQRISPTNCRSPAGSRSSRRPTAPACAPRVTVMFGHVEGPGARRAHARRAHVAGAPASGFAEFVPLSFIPYHTLLGHPWDRGALARGEPDTAAFRLALGKTIPSLQASWVRMGHRRRDRGAARASTTSAALMEESISRMAETPVAGSSHPT